MFLKVESADLDLLAQLAEVRGWGDWDRSSIVRGLVAEMHKKLTPVQRCKLAAKAARAPRGMN